MVGISIILFRGNLSAELDLIFIYFHQSDLSFWVSSIDLTKPLILIDSSSVLSLVGNSVKYLLLSIYVSEKKAQRN